MEHDELLEFFLAALQAVASEVTVEQKILLREVLDGMLREQDQALGTTWETIASRLPSGSRKNAIHSSIPTGPNRPSSSR